MIDDGCLFELLLLPCCCWSTCEVDVTVFVISSRGVRMMKDDEEKEKEHRELLNETCE